MATTQIRGSTQIKDATVTVNKLSIDADLPMGAHKITGLVDGVNPQDAVTKAQLDGMASGIDIKGSVKVATTGNITLSGTQTIDGVALSVGDRVLVKNQTTGTQNGIYVVASGAWVRSTDADTSAKVTSGMFTFVEQGTVNATTGQVLSTSNPITLGTTALTFVQFSEAGQITAGAGLSQTGSVISLSDHTHQSAGVQGGKLDHGLALNGLADDDHTQYWNDTRGDAKVATHAALKTVHGLVTPVAANDFMIASGVGAWAKKTLAEAKAILGITTISDDTAIHDNVAGEISVLTSKVIPTDNDVMLMEDSAASFAKKKISFIDFLGWLIVYFTPANHVGSGGAAHADATTSVDGFMTAADKTKLDGLGTSYYLMSQFVHKEVPSGLINGSNAIFSLIGVPTNNSEHVFKNGILQNASGNDYTLSGMTITFVAGSIPQTGDVVLVSYIAAGD